MLNFDDFEFDFEEKEEKKETKKEAVKSKAPKSEDVDDVADELSEESEEDEEDDSFDDIDFPDEEENSSKKTTTKKKTASKSGKKDIKVKCPVTVKGPNFTMRVESANGSFTPTLTEVSESVYERFKEVAVLVPIYDEKEGVLYYAIPDTKISKNDIKDELGSSVNISKNSVCVSFGEIQGEYDSTFLEDEEVSLGDVARVFCENGNVEFAKASWLYVPKALIVMPYATSYPERTKENELLANGITHISVCGEVREVNPNGELSLTELAEMSFEEGEFRKKCSFLFGRIGDVLHIFLKTSVKYEIMDSFVKDKSATGKKLEERYILSDEKPLNLWLYNFNINRVVTPAAFGGKTKITKQDVVNYLMEDISAFGDAERGVDTIYDKTSNTLSIGIHSGKKGRYHNASFDYEETEHYGPFKLIRTEADYNDAIALSNVGFFHSELFRIENTPVFRFIQHLKEKKEDEASAIQFTYKLPKIPAEILDGVVRHFQQYAEKEMIVEILYNRLTERYTIAYPQTYESNTMHILYNMQRSVMDAVEYKVMQIHSHASASAYFSATDNRDEKLCGIYGVIGRIDKPTPEMVFRVSYESSAKLIPVEDLFAI